MSNKLINAIGIITLFTSVAYLIKKINKQSETRLISDQAFDVLQNSDNVKKLDTVVSKYHKTGEWDKAALKNIH